MSAQNPPPQSKQPVSKLTLSSTASQQTDPSKTAGEPDGQSSTTKPASSQQSPRLKQLTDIGNARFFVARYKDEIRYCRELKTWFVWDGKRWAPDRIGEIVRKAKDTAIKLYGYASQGADDDERRRIAQHAIKTQSEPRLNAMISLAQTEAAISILLEDLDSDPWLLNVANGTLNLKSGQLRQFKKSDLITKLTPVNYDTNATCPRWDKFLSEVLNGDVDRIRYLQKIVGYALTGVTREQVFFIFYGLGENGKTTCITTLLSLLGEYAKSAPITTFLRKNPNTIPHDVARLQGARFVAADENEEGSKLAEAQMKQLTGGGTISARHLYSGTFSFQATFKIVLDVNHLPIIKGTEHAVWRRIRPVSFKVTIASDKRDKTLDEKLKAELPGILRWAMEGCLLWQKEGIEPPESEKLVAKIYREDQDVVKKFVDECCESVSSATTPFRDLYDSFEQWCTDNGETLLNVKEFGKRLTERGYEAERKPGVRVRMGIKLRPLIQTPVPGMTHDA